MDVKAGATAALLNSELPLGWNLTSTELNSALFCVREKQCDF